MSKYRPDVDGLRTIAVMSVVLYHGGISGFSGGYVGVDVFFVISGFLITGVIAEEVGETGRLRFVNFYTRRFWRLFPAFFTTALVTLAGAMALFAPDEMRRFSGSLLFAVFSSSNFFFWWESGYFDAAARVKPLLHTWSLSVEEQFYLLWPAVLTITLTRFGRAAALAFIFLACVVSLIVAEILLSQNPSAAFLLLPARIVELGIGASLVWVIDRQPANRNVLDILLAAALVAIMVPVFSYDEASRFPGISSLLPCAGAALAIYAGSAPRVGTVLRNRFSVTVGKASYSIYLVHWPLIVFWAAYTYRPLRAAEGIAISLASVALGFLQWHFVEQKFRLSATRPNLRVSLVAPVLVALLAIPALAIWVSDGARWRIPDYRAGKTGKELQRQEVAGYCQSFNAVLPRELFTCQNHRGSNHDIIIWGDSHAQHLVAGFSKAFPKHNIYVMNMNGCVPQSGFSGYVRHYRDRPRTERCVERNKAALEFLRRHKPSTVIITSAKRSTPKEVAPAINEIIRRSSRAGHIVHYLADFIRPGKELGACRNVPAILISDSRVASRCVEDEAAERRELAYNDQLEDLVSAFIPVTDAQCPRGDCQFFEGSTPLFRDSHHLSVFGSTKMVAKIAARIQTGAARSASRANR